MHELLNKYFAGAITQEETYALFKETDNDPALKKEFARIQNIMAISGMAHKENDEQWTEHKMRELMQKISARRRRRFSVSVLKYAAVAAIVGLVWIFAYQNINKETGDAGYTYVEVPRGQTIHIILPDGTETWLSSRTKLTIPAQFNKKERSIELDGEAFFSVSKDEGKPFTVKTKQYNVRVTGTQFNVFAYSESDIFKTDLLEGSVFIYDKDKGQDGDILYLNPEETAYLKDGALTKSQSAFSYSRFVMNGIYYFENASFKDIKDCLELWYSVKIHLRREEISLYVFSGKFRQSDNIELILQAIKETGKFDYKLINEHEIEIY
ncbi:MAG: FecR family protein [Tannerellaceae bacterium]|jgi:ferric-dicitrate binding protein FerR (iron transport regulator)|nr:FecR family protein [Tannerellaceae bacterium]